MKKKLILSTAFLIFIQDAYSNETSHHFNIGVGAGQNHGNFSYESTETDVNRVPQVNAFRNSDLGKTSPAGEISLGYGSKWNQVYMGLETSYLFTNLKRDRNLQLNDDGSLSRPAQIKSNGAFNVAAKLGYYIRNDFVGYIGAGIENRKFKIQYTVSNQPESSINTGKRQTAFAARIGFDYSINPALTIGAEYRKAFYQKKNFVRGITSLRVKPKTVDTMLINLRYKIDFSKNKKTL